MMNKLLLFSFVCFVSFATKAQVSYSPMNIESFVEAPFKYKGKRVLMGDRIDTPDSKNIFLITKTDQGAIPDMMYVQQFEKKNDIWLLKKDTTITANETIIFWGNRKAFVPNKSDKELIAIYTYCTGNAQTNKYSTVYLLAFYRQGIYSLKETYDKETSESENFGLLSKSTKEAIYEYWNEMDRWKR